MHNEGLQVVKLSDYETLAHGDESNVPVSSCDTVLTDGVGAGGADDSGRNRINSSWRALKQQ